MLEVDPVQIILVRKNTGYSGGDMIGKEGDVRDWNHMIFTSHYSLPIRLYFLALTDENIRLLR